jgi:hypothetical protein
VILKTAAFPAIAGVVPNPEEIEGVLVRAKTTPVWVSLLAVKFAKTMLAESPAFRAETEEALASRTAPAVEAVPGPVKDVAAVKMSAEGVVLHAGTVPTPAELSRRPVATAATDPRAFAPVATIKSPAVALFGNARVDQTEAVPTPPDRR